jgi:hypothetical protein
MASHSVIIYGAGTTGLHVYLLLTKKENGMNIVAFCDTYKTGMEPKAGLQIIRPENLKEYEDAIIIIGVSDYLKVNDVQDIEQELIRQNIKQDNILRYSQLLKLLSNYNKEDFEWQHFMDDIYNFDINIHLIGELSRCIDINDKSVVDLGAGAMNLRRFIPPDSLYYPVDYKRRCDQTIVCDFNKREFPNINADVYVLCAMLYYVDDPIWLLEKSAEFASRKIIIALNNKSLAEYPEAMHAEGYKNYIFFNEIASTLKKYGFIDEKDVTLEDIARRFVLYTRS